MILSLLLRTAAAALVAAAAASAGTPSGTARPVISLSATPAHLTLLGRIPETVLVHNDGSTRIQVTARAASFAFDVYGNAAIAPRSEPPRSAHAWLVVRPRRLVLAPGGEGTLRVVARAPRHASVGDHHALVLLSALAPGHARVTIRTRIGVLVLVRVPGRIVRRVAIGRVRVARARRGRSIVVGAVNRGNIAERLLPGQVTVTLRRAGHVVAVARALPRDLLPHTRGVLVVPLKAPLRGIFTAVVRIAAQPGWTAGTTAPRLRSASRRFLLRL